MQQAHLTVMHLYTLVLDYVGGTYVSQVSAGSPKEAIIKGAQNLNVSEVWGLGSKGKQLLVEQMREDEPVALNGLANVWCGSALLRGKSVLITLIATEGAAPQG
jgi:hypothetical protein